jgi:hypothetical protein
LYKGAFPLFGIGFALSPNGTIYGITPIGGSSTACGQAQGCGTFFELTPPTTKGGAWTRTVLHNFTGQDGDGYQPNTSLLVTKGGVVYGTTYYGGSNFFGAVFEYVP